MKSSTSELGLIGAGKLSYFSQCCLFVAKYKTTAVERMNNIFSPLVLLIDHHLPHDTAQ